MMRFDQHIKRQVFCERAKINQLPPLESRDNEENGIGSIGPSLIKLNIPNHELFIETGKTDLAFDLSKILQASLKEIPVRQNRYGGGSMFPIRRGDLDRIEFMLEFRPDQSKTG